MELEFEEVYKEYEISDQLNDLSLNFFSETNEIIDNSYEYNDIYLAQKYHLYESYTKVDLIKIAEYYCLDKKVNKYSKRLLIDCIIEFEKDINNHLMVKRREILWSFLDELKLDEKTKKYVIW
jgi:hypothetical protein